MRIAQVSPLFESVPPRLYGGTERIVSFLTEELVRKGHQISLFASGDSLTTSELVPCAPRALRLDSRVKDPLPHYTLMMEKVRQRAHEFDIIHFHIDHLQHPLMRMVDVPHVTTLHGRQDMTDLQPLYREFDRDPRVSISMSQRQPVPFLNFAGNVYHGLPKDLLTFSPSPTRGYLAFLGRMSPEKGPEEAIEIAVRAGIPLKMAAKIDPADQAYFDQRIKPLLDQPLIEYVGEINDHHKAEFLGGAQAMLFPINWPEPFGIVMIEAMACGTPVIAFPCGSVLEVIDDGVTGVLVNDIEQAVEAARTIHRFDRRRVRAHFERRFTANRMADDYLAIYERVIAERRRDKGEPTSARSGIASMKAKPLAS
ncbi:Glycosyltransferase involved in cell wall bisynthesis [Arboricoccus pini]|uniref:Glycosyltransferase involved in cell wall bisynthesis n=1 Tax=Arboricoccus pini TaxID=1963835 RepID=A0A212R8C8_9PROT|nr:glycosyltransferase family 4 protein [Arboricoccus pini]SNB68412.1 Glycosyltransferase involved in cell wall bisynthesis [Arboricoccus pini]